MLIGISGKTRSGKDTVGHIINHLYGLDQLVKAGGKISDVMYPEGWTWDKVALQGSPFELWKRKKFADKLKETIALWLGCTRQDLESEEFKSKILGPEWDKYVIYNFGKLTNKILLTEEEAVDYCSRYTCSQHNYTWVRKQLTVRDLMLLLGTDCGRNIIHPNIWINATFSDYTPKSWFKYKDQYIQAEEFAIKLARLKDFTIRKDLSTGEVLPNWLITDVRFPNELQAILDRKGIDIRVKRYFHLRFPEYKEIITSTDELYSIPEKLYEVNPDLYERLTHSSETSLDDCIFNCNWVLFNNSTVDHLVKSVYRILKEEQIINFDL